MNLLGIVFSNLHDKNLNGMTDHRTLASVPFGGRYRLIDFVLSSMVNSGVEKVGIITKNNYQSLMDHVGSGKHWDLARKNGGLIVLPPYGGQDSTSLYENRLEALMGITSFIKSSKEEFVVMSDCDNVANVNYEDVLKQHEVTNADITMIYREKNITNANKMRSIVELDKSGKVTKSYSTQSLIGKHNVYTNMMILRRDFLVKILETSAINGSKSFSKDIIAKNIDKYKIYGYKFSGYFASIDSIANYYKHTLELLDLDNRKSLFFDQPVYTKNRDSAPTIYSQTAHVSNSLIADGCRVEGTVINSILFRDVHVAKGAVVSNSIIMQGSVVSQNANVNCIIADKNVIIKEKRNLSGCEQLPYYIFKGTTL